MPMKEPIVIRPALAAQFAAAMENGRVVLFTAPCGFGKSVTAQVLLAGWQVCVLSADAPDFALLTFAPPGSSFDCIATTPNGWHAIPVGGQIGWISDSASRIDFPPQIDF